MVRIDRARMERDKELAKSRKQALIHIRKSHLYLPGPASGGKRLRGAFTDTTSGWDTDRADLSTLVDRPQQQLDGQAGPLALSGPQQGFFSTQPYSRSSRLSP